MLTLFILFISYIFVSLNYEKWAWPTQLIKPIIPFESSLLTFDKIYCIFEWKIGSYKQFY
jgi:hypothetical protein